MSSLVNYRSAVMQIEDAYRERHGAPLHDCGECFATVLESVFQPMLEMAIAKGKAEQREDTVKTLLPECGGTAEKR